jgi:transcription antitermination factor NusG
MVHDSVKIVSAPAVPEVGSCDHGAAYGPFFLPPKKQFTTTWAPMNDGRGVSDLTGTWYVSFVRDKHERAYAWDIHRLGTLTNGAVGYLLPLMEYKVRRPNRAWVIRKRPLLTGRVMFVCVSDDRIDIDPNRRTSKITAALDTSSPERLRSNLLAIEKFLLADASRVDPFPFAKVGSPVKVANGPLQGVKGEVVYADGERRKFVIIIDCLGQKISYELEDDVDLEPID